MSGSNQHQTGYPHCWNSRRIVTGELTGELTEEQSGDQTGHPRAHAGGSSANPLTLGKGVAEESVEKEIAE